MTLPDYTDVEHMIFRGFLVEPTEIEGIPIVFKTLNQTEYELASLYSISSDPVKETLLRECYFIASSVYLFDRSSVFKDREVFYHGFVEVLQEFPDQVRLHILQRLQKLNARALAAMRQVEGFSYGVESRQRWALLHNLSPNDPRVTGIPGTEYLGLNSHQRLWFYYNNEDDKRDDAERDWSNAKFLASVHSKEVSKIDSQDKTRRRDELRRREAIFYGDTPEDGMRGVNGEVKVSHESVDDLLGQLKRDIEGQKDFHDQVVEAHEAQVRERWQAMQEEKARRAMEARQNKQSRFGPDVKDPVIFYDEEAVKRATEDRRAQKREALLRGDFADEESYQTQRERLKKWGILEDERPEPHREAARHPLADTIMGDYYDVQMPDMSKTSPFDDE